MKIPATITAALASMPPDKAQWLKAHCKRFGHDLGEAISIVWLYRAAPDFETWCKAVASRLRNHARCMQHGAKNRNYLKKLAFCSFDDLELLAGDDSDPLGWVLGMEALENFSSGRKPRKTSARELAEVTGLTPRQCRNVLKKQAEIDLVQLDFWGG